MSIMKIYSNSFSLKRGFYSITRIVKRNLNLMSLFTRNNELTAQHASRLDQSIAKVVVKDSK